MLEEASYFSALPKRTLKSMIEVVKGVEPEVGYGAILQLSEVDAAMRETRIRRTKTVCTYCGVGCSFDIWTQDRHILKVEPANGPANGISTCVKGKFSWDFVNSTERRTKPLIRENGKFREASWDEALNLVATKFTEFKKNHGPDALSFISSSKCTNEESYLMQKLARAVIGTCRYADVVFPASPSLEKEGTFTSTERRIQRLYQVFEPLGDSKPDWQIIQAVANRLGADWSYEHPSEILAEVASLTPLMAGVSYERLEGYKSLQWPVAEDGTDQPLLYTKNFNFPDGKAKLHPVAWTEPPFQESSEYDLHLNNGRLLEHFHEGNLTYKTAGTRESAPSTFVEVSPQLAHERGLESGSWVELISPFGKVRVQVLVTDRVHGHELYMPMNSSTEAINRLTSSYTDKETHTPAYKETSVKMVSLGTQSHSPLPRTNFRFGHPTPQKGVEVERKWKRADYRKPGTRSKPMYIPTKE